MNRNHSSTFLHHGSSRVKPTLPPRCIISIWDPPENGECTSIRTSDFPRSGARVTQMILPRSFGAAPRRNSTEIDMRNGGKSILAAAAMSADCSQTRVSCILGGLICPTDRRDRDRPTATVHPSRPAYYIPRATHQIQDLPRMLFPTSLHYLKNHEKSSLPL